MHIDLETPLPYNTSYEHYIPAKEEKAQKNPWLPCKIQIQAREKNNPTQETERALETYRLMPHSILSLQRAKDFEAVFKKGRGVGENGLFLRFTRSSNLVPSRFGIVISKKVSAKAVTRNRKRRLLKEAIRAYGQELKKGVDAVIVVQPTFGAQNLSQTKAIVEKLFRKASLFT